MSPGEPTCPLILPVQKTETTSPIDVPTVEQMLRADPCW
jgi:hypothetical protein